jgi:hypothetical protein
VGHVLRAVDELAHGVKHGVVLANGYSAEQRVDGLCGARDLEFFPTKRLRVSAARTSERTIQPRTLQQSAQGQKTSESFFKKASPKTRASKLFKKASPKRAPAFGEAFIERSEMKSLPCSCWPRPRHCPRRH